MQKIETMNTIQKKIGYGHGRGGQSKSCVKIKKNVTEKDIEKYLDSKEEDTPKIVIFLDGEKIEMISIIGDGIIVNIESKSLEYSLVVLTACYYVYDLAFPRKYEQFLEFIKHCIFKDEDKKKKKSSGFIEMLFKMEKIK